MAGAGARDRPDRPQHGWARGAIGLSLRTPRPIASSVGAKTVETHVRSVFQKLELAETPEGNRRVQAVLEWLRAAPPPDS